MEYKRLLTVKVRSDKAEYKNINKTTKVRKLKKRRLQHRISEKYARNKKGVCYCKTHNKIKSEKQFLRITHRLPKLYRNNVFVNFTDRK